MFHFHLCLETVKELVAQMCSTRNATFEENNWKSKLELNMMDCLFFTQQKAKTLASKLSCSTPFLFKL